MDNNTNTIKQLKNAKGKRMLEKIILEYSKEIIDGLVNNPDILFQVLDNLEITEEDFFSYLSGEKKGNIAVYDQALLLVRKRIKDHSN